MSRAFFQCITMLLNQLLQACCRGSFFERHLVCCLQSRHVLDNSTIWLALLLSRKGVALLFLAIHPTCMSFSFFYLSYDMHWVDREHLKSPSQSKRQRRSPPTPGSPAFEELPAVSIPFVDRVFFNRIRIYLVLRSVTLLVLLCLKTRLCLLHLVQVLRGTCSYTRNYRTANSIFIRFSNSRPKFEIV